MELGKIARAKSLPHTKNRGQRLTLTFKQHWRANMKAIGGLAAVFVIVAAATVIAGTPVATTSRMQTVGMIESQSDEAPPYT